MLYVGWDLARVCITPTLCPEPIVAMREREDASDVLGPLWTSCPFLAPAGAGEGLREVIHSGDDVSTGRGAGEGDST